MAGNSPRDAGIGSELRQARKAAGMHGYQVAEILGVARGTVSRWETGERHIDSHYLTRYLLAVNASPELIAELLEASTKPDEAQWLAVDLLDHKRQQAALLELERTATCVSSVSPMLIAGILQTSEYTRAIMLAAKVPRDEIDARVAVRVGRREALDAERLQFHVYIGEAAIRASVGGPGVMQRQLAYLAEQAGRENVIIRVLPLRCDWHAGMDGPFTYFEFGDGREPIVHVENRISGLFVYNEPHVSSYRIDRDRIREMAMSPADSMGLIAEAITGTETAA